VSTLLDPAAQVLVDGQTAYRRVVNVTAVRGDASETLRVVAGTITQDARTPGRWSGSVQVQSKRVPTEPSDVLASFGSELFVEAGVATLDGVESTVPLGVLPITGTDAAVVADGAVVSLQLGDRASRISGHRFVSPMPVGASQDLAAVAAQVVETRDPRLETDTPASGVTVGDVTDGEPYLFGAASSVDPWRELTDLLAGGGLRCYFDRAGSLVVDEVPTGVPGTRRVLPEQAVVSFSGRPPNVVVVRSSVSANPAWGVWEDDDPDSPTYVDGPYGRVTMFADAPVRSDAGAATTARRIGAKLQGAGASWRVVRGFDPTWDPGDSVTIQVGADQIVTLAMDAVTVDLLGGTTMIARAFTP